MDTRRIFMKLVTVCVLSAFIFGTVVSCGGGGGNGGSQSLNFSDPNQAASASNEAAGTAVLADTLSSSASDMVGSSADTAGYAPNKTGSKDTTAIAQIDPRLKTLVDKMAAQMKATGAKNAKIRSKMSMATQVDLTSDCSSTTGMGTFSVSGTTNTTEPSRTFNESTVTITFTNCKDSATLSEMNGSIVLYSKVTPTQLPITEAISNVTVNNLTFNQYEGSFSTTPVETGVINGTFNNTYNVTSASADSNGSFTFSNGNSKESGEFFFRNLTSNWSTSSDGGATTDIVSINGSYGFSFTNGVDSVSLTIGLTNLEYKQRTYDGYAYIDKWLNGTISIVWDPMYCASGTITFTTAENTPLRYTDIYDTCPDSGTLQVNNATIVYDKDNLINPILVTVNGVTYPFANCAAMDAAGDGMCI